jgi:hypothetical protein
LSPQAAKATTAKTLQPLPCVFTVRNRQSQLNPKIARGDDPAQPPITDHSTMAGMDAEEVERALVDAELVTCLQAPLGEAKQLRDACLVADIPVVLDRAACCGAGGCGCAPKVELRARPDDLPRVARLVQERWRDLLLREGTVAAESPAAALPASDGDDPPCPACGTASPLVAGACADCGLQLA